MIASRRVVVSCVLAAFVMSGAVAFAEGPFKDLSYKKALEQAGKDKSLVFIDFYTTWCGPCKMMDASTFKDEKVVKWLNEKAVALHVDAERDVDLAEKFNIEFYPTLVFIKPDGSEFERMSGYLTPAEFMEIASAVEKGESVVDKARKESEASPDDPVKKLKLAEALGMRGKTEEAVKLLTWCLDHGVEKNPEFADARDSAVVSLLAQFAEGDEKVMKDLFDRRDAAEKRILDGSPQGPDVALYVMMNQFDDANKRTLDTYDKVITANPKSDAAQQLAPFLFNLLLEAERYEDIAKSVDIMAKVEEISKNATNPPAEATRDMPADQVETMTAIMRQGGVYELSSYYQVLVGLGRADEAAKVAELALKLDDSADTYNALAWAGYLSGKPLPENVTQAGKAWNLDGKKSASILDTLVRVMYARGQHDEAIKLCEDFLARAETERDKWIIETCLNEFRSGSPK